MSKRYDLVDLLKLIASILVFATHIKPLSSVNENIQLYAIGLLARWCVPFFFTVSSFFLFKKSENNNISKEQLVKYVRRIALLYLVWFIINLPHVIYLRLFSTGISNPQTWFSAIKGLLFSSTFTGSWYLSSSIFSAIFVYLMSKKFSTKTTLAFSSILYLICVLTSAYGKILPQNLVDLINLLFVPPYNSIICGCFFFALGKYLAENRKAFEKIPPKTSACFSLLFGALYYLEIIILKKFDLLTAIDSSFMVVPWALFTVIMCLNSNCVIKNTSLMRKLSTIIYCSQGLLILVSKFFVERILSINNSIFVFIIGAILEVICCITVLFLQKHSKAKWVQYLT